MAISSQPASTAPGAWLKRVRQAYLERGNGWVEGGGRELFVRRGELYIDRDGDLAETVRPLLDRIAGLARPAADGDVGAVIDSLAGDLFASTEDAAWHIDAPRGVELIGPLPLIVFLLAVVERMDDRWLVRLIGGPNARVSTRDRTPALEQLSGLDGDMARVLSQLDSPTSVGEVLRAGDRVASTRALAKLWVVGLVGGEIEHERRGLVPAKLLERFLDRIAEMLDSEPVELDTASHREEVARWVSETGDLDYYQVLGLERAADDGAILEAFERSARRLHPRHASTLGLAGKEDTLRLLFERATDAYLTLSDPVRRSKYDTLIGHHREIEIDDSQRLAEKQVVARQHYIRGSSALAEMDYSTAVDLLKEAARIDPKPEYFARLGAAQSKNPRWRRHAVDSYARAVDLKPGDAGLHLGLAKVLEGEERLDEAREHYARAIELMPDNADAQLGLERLGSTNAPTTGGGLRAALARRKGT